MFFRYDKCRSVTSSRTWIPYAVPARLPECTVRNNARMLAQGSDEATNLWNPSMETRRLLHHGRIRIQRSISILRSRPPAWLDENANFSLSLSNQDGWHKICSQINDIYTLKNFFNAKKKHIMIAIWSNNQWEV